MANLRDAIIDRLWESFYSITKDPHDPDKSLDTTKPVMLESLLARFTLPTDLKDALPAVSFGYGGSRLVDGGFTQEERNIFSVYVYPIVPILEDILPLTDTEYDEKSGTALLKSASAMEETIRLITHDLNAYTITSDDGCNYVEGVSVGQVLTGEGKFTEYEFMEFRIDFQVAYTIPLDAF